jgi:predicted Fe-S protein YdhL (DUF1289 family)
MTDSPAKPVNGAGHSTSGRTPDSAASDGVWTRQEIESPCVKICMIHPDAKICVGCYRTGAEIAAWSRMAPEERRTIMQQLDGRSGRLSRRSGGRRGRIARGDA